MHAGFDLKLIDLCKSIAEPKTVVLYAEKEDPLTALEVFPLPSHFLALASSCKVVLLDSRHPQDALLKWNHGIISP